MTLNKNYITIVVLFIISFVLFPVAVSASEIVTGPPKLFNDSGWTMVYQENLDTDFVASDGQTFGTDDWLIFQLLNDGAITVANGYAQLNAPDFWNAALIRSTNTLPDEYKIRTKIGYINYDLTNYEQADYDDPDFNDHGGNYENGMYFLTVTDDTCSGNQCAELWWHYHRKMVIDIDNHVPGVGGDRYHPVFMVYMAPETNSGGNLLRTWTGTYWDESDWNWSVAHTYEYDTWYYAELEKRDDSIILRLYDESQNIIEETTPVSLDKIFAMDDSTEFLYVGEPHTDDYEGNVRIDEITLYTPDALSDIDDQDINTNLPNGFAIAQNYPNPFNPGTNIEYEIPIKSHIKIIVYNILGQEIKTIVDQIKSAGKYMTDWDGTDSNGKPVSSGVYYYKLESDGFVDSKKMVLVR